MERHSGKRLHCDTNIGMWLYLQSRLSCFITLSLRPRSTLNTLKHREQIIVPNQREIKLAASALPRCFVISKPKETTHPWHLNWHEHFIEGNWNTYLGPQGAHSTWITQQTFVLLSFPSFFEAQNSVIAHL